MTPRQASNSQACARMELEKTHYRTFFFFIIVTALLVAAVSVLVRPISPVNETLYSGVAWEMWAHHHILVPLVNDHTYNQKPPLFFWLTELGWKIAGVNNWWPIFLPALCSLGSIYLTSITAHKLFKSSYIGLLSAFILCGMAYWAYYAPRVRLDQLLTLCTMLSVYGLTRCIRGQRYGFILFAVGNGLGLLTKGPICFIFTLIPSVCAAFTFKDIQKSKWFLALLGTLAISFLIVGCWAVPIMITHPHYAKSILWEQTVSRLMHTHHAQIGVWYYYIPRLPLLVMPWLLWPAIWYNLKNTRFKSNTTLRWLCYSILTVFGVLSFLISQKASRFLLPLFPFIAMLFAYLISQAEYELPSLFNKLVGVIFITMGCALLLLQPILTHFKFNSSSLIYYHGLWGLLPIMIGLVWWRFRSYNKLYYTALITLSSCSITVLLYGTIIHMHTPNDDMQRIGTLIRELQNQGKTVAFITRYDDRFEFPGRITQPLAPIQDTPNAVLWGLDHPTGFIIDTVRKPIPHSLIQPLYQQPYRHKQVVQVWRAMDYALVHNW